MGGTKRAPATLVGVVHARIPFLRLAESQKHAAPREHRLTYEGVGGGEGGLHRGQQPLQRAPRLVEHILARPRLAQREPRRPDREVVVA